MNMLEDRAVERIVEAWLKRGGNMATLDHLDTIKSALYALRNGIFKAGELASDLVSEDQEIMAAVEQYFFARSEVCSGEYSFANMKMLIFSYQLARGLGFGARDTKGDLSISPSALQKHWALRGAKHGERDRVQENALRKISKIPLIEPPFFRLPPKFMGARKSVKLDQFKD